MQVHSIINLQSTRVHIKTHIFSLSHSNFILRRTQGTQKEKKNTLFRNWQLTEAKSLPATEREERKREGGGVEPSQTTATTVQFFVFSMHPDLTNCFLFLSKFLFIENINLLVYF
jgi:hypothetical protein